MKKASAFTRATLVAVLCVGTATWASAQYPIQPPGQTPGQTPARETEKERPGHMASIDQPTKANKASELVCMKVQNQAGEELGHIRDIVFDLNSERVVYCVLGTAEGILSPEKLHAVPLRAFQASEDGSYLTLNADKEKLAQAEGFDRNNWPSMTTPAWGAEPFWTKAPKPLPWRSPSRNGRMKSKDETKCPGIRTGQAGWTTRNHGHYDGTGKSYAC
jgi:sporulation protein YlmC with PRC-barrel domain